MRRLSAEELPIESDDRQRGQHKLALSPEYGKRRTKDGQRNNRTSE